MTGHTTARRPDAAGGFEVHTKVWIERNGAVVISDFLVELLEAVAEHRSVAAAGGAERPEREFLGVWITEFEFRLDVAPGVSRLELVAVDQGGESTIEAYSVDYVVPVLEVVVGFPPRSLRGGVSRRRDRGPAGAPSAAASAKAFQSLHRRRSDS